MFLHEKTYDIDELARHNLHIHTRFSGCAKPEMTARDIIKTAEAAGLEMIAMTDHNYIDKQNAVAQQRYDILREIADMETNVKVYIGAELSSYGVGKFADDIACDNSLDYRLYTTNHYHQKYWEHPEVKTPRAYAEHMLAIIDGVIESGRADCFAHPFMSGYIHAFDDFKDVTKAFTDNELGDIMKKAYEHEIAWEINVPAVMKDPEFHKRYFNIGKEIGVVFNMGTDAHLLCNIDPKQFADKLKIMLY
ncbi:MAG: PHP domain-containing protein [Clostridia bacterium]|nr:PHP domain-containing protein [Clostridia bacterium]